LHGEIPPRFYLYDLLFSVKIKIHILYKVIDENNNPLHYVKAGQNFNIVIIAHLPLESNPEEAGA
jgi:hypothetical protein